uniref:photosystem I assembly protein Ycf4 n=1 Tax=Chorispora sibirica TaxID=282603 RepID=UPI0026E1D0BA|nr:photosystem I assembly protein Ycf4 [Chorispora sibirica]YP_010895778.1 Ycf4 [Chorispora songarica]WJZ19687.1 photosystem I assembly protein Ycf4 [Chorispora sibirica]WJZ19818.1 Ycf4 [Chorispora songarica]
MSGRSESVWIEFITGSQTKSNIFWAFIIFLGSLGFLLVGTSSYLGLGRTLLSVFLSLRRNFRSLFWFSEIIIFPVPSSFFEQITFLPPPQIDFFPQGIVMSFYGIAGLFISCYLWCTILWHVGSGYNLFDRKTGRGLIFRWGFPGKSRRIFLRFLMKDIQSIRIKVKEGFSARRVLYLKIRGQGTIPLIGTDENLTTREIEQKAAELADFLRVPIEVFLKD